MIQMTDIRKSFPRPEGGRLDVLKSIDLEVGSGELVAVVGRSGSGKSTLMNLLGLLDQPDSGDYRLDGRSMIGLAADDRARVRNRAIGFVFQQFHLLPRTTAVENVELPLIYSDAVDSTDRAVEALCRVGLEERLGHYPGQLSGGQQQRVAIARALVTDPALILADEPTGNLDRASTDDIMRLLVDLNRSGRTIVLITHDPELAARCSTVLTIDDGVLTRDVAA